MACPARRASTSTLSTRRGLDGVWWRALAARRSIVERSKDTDTNLLELLALRRRLDVLEMHQRILREVHDLPEVVEEALVALEALEQLDQGLGADLLVVPAEIENKTTPGIVR